jgi:Ca-activated chloride channel family protein
VVRSDATLESARRFLEGVRAQGGTNIHDALLEALRQRPSEGMLPIVLFLTDGLPTVGTTSEVAIRRLASEANPHRRRVFTLGVGTDVNVPLLDKLASATGATPTYVLPGEDVEVKVAQLFKRLAGPILADLRLEALDAQGRPEPSRTSDRIPAALPDLFDGEQLTVLGQYRGEEALRFRLSGNHLGTHRTFAFTCDLEGATTRNAFVSRLWASRKIGVLLDAVRELGADGTSWTGGAPAPDAKTRELTDEILRLSVKYGILTEYTAFLAREGTDLWSREQIVAQAAGNLHQRAQNTRVGLGAANQSANVQFMSNQTVLNSANTFLTADMSRVSVATVQQVNDLAFYQRAGRWVDSRLVGRSDRPDRVVTIGSKEFAELAERLAGQHREGSVALRGEVLLEVDGQTILVK